MPLSVEFGSRPQRGDEELLGGQSIVPQRKITIGRRKLAGQMMGRGPSSGNL